MKKFTRSIVLFSSAFVLGLAILPACNKGNTDSSEQTQQLITGNLTFDIPILPKNGEYDTIVKFNYKINMDSFVKSFNQQYDTTSIRKVSLTSCILRLNSDTTADNFRNFHTVNIGINSGTFGYIHRMAAFNNIVDTAAYTLSVPTLYEPNLAQYMKADSINYFIYGNLRRPTTKTLKCSAELHYDMYLSE